MENILHEMRSSFASIQALALALVVTGAASSPTSSCPNLHQITPQRNTQLLSILLSSQSALANINRVPTSRWNSSFPSRCHTVTEVS